MSHRITNTFHGKAGLLNAAYDVAMAGDDEPGPNRAGSPALMSQVLDADRGSPES